MRVQATEIVECIRNSGTDIMVDLHSGLLGRARAMRSGTMQARIGIRILIRTLVVANQEMLIQSAKVVKNRQCTR